MGGHVFLEYVFLEYMSFRITCLMRAICLKGDHVLLEEMSYGNSCIGGVHVFKMAYLTI